MKKIEAYIRHEAFEPIRMELLALGFPSLTISEVKGSGRQKGITERYRGAELTNYLRPKVKLECVVAERDVQLAAEPHAWRLDMTAATTSAGPFSWTDATAGEVLAAHSSNVLRRRAGAQGRADQLSSRGGP